MFYVYGLIDPRDNQIHYVGITRNTPARRLASHITSGGSAKDNWIASLLDAGFLPTITVLQSAATYQEIFEMESWWIRLAEVAGWPITNTNKTNRHIVRDVHGFVLSETMKAQDAMLNPEYNVTASSAHVVERPSTEEQERGGATSQRARRSRRRPRRVAASAS